LAIFEYAPPPPPFGPTLKAEKAFDPPPPPPMSSIVLFEEFQSLGTVQIVPEVRKITVAAFANSGNAKRNARAPTVAVGVRNLKNCFLEFISGAKISRAALFYHERVIFLHRKLSVVN